MKILKNLILITLLTLISTQVSFAQSSATFQNGYSVGVSLAGLTNDYECITHSYSSWPSVVKTTITQYNNSGHYAYADGVETGFRNNATYCSWQNNGGDDPTGGCDDCQTWERDDEQ